MEHEVGNLRSFRWRPRHDSVFHPRACVADRSAAVALRRYPCSCRIRGPTTQRGARRIGACCQFATERASSLDARSRFPLILDRRARSNQAMQRTASNGAAGMRATKMGVPARVSRPGGLQSNALFFTLPASAVVRVCCASCTAGSRQLTIPTPPVLSHRYRARPYRLPVGSPGAAFLTLLQSAFIMCPAYRLSLRAGIASGRRGKTLL
jgi:hypothetical protein